MRGYIILLLGLLLTSCSSNKERSPSETLVQYYRAISDNDSSRALALSAEGRAKIMRAYPNQYFQPNDTLTFEAISNGERQAMENQVFVSFVQVVKNRKTGDVLASDSSLCEMLKENSEWKVYQCLVD